MSLPGDPAATSENHPIPDGLWKRWLARAGRRVFPSRLALGLAGVAAGALLFRPGDFFGPYRAVGLAGAFSCVLAGLALRAWGAGSAGDHTRSATIEAPRLATGGPYAHVRNPIYLGSILLGLGMVGLLGDARLLAIHLIVFAILYLVIIPAEEQFLRRQFGAEFSRYCAHVRRFLPRFQPWPGATEARFHWRAARGEAGIAALLLLIYVGLQTVAWLRALV